MIKKYMRTAMAAMVLAALNACGGGSSPSGTATPSGVQSQGCQANGSACPLTLTPASLVEQFDEGTAVAINVDFTSTITSGPVYVRVLDPSGIIDPVITLMWSSQTDGSAQMHSLATARPGRYQASLQIELCRDQLCNSPISGSPILLPYDITVQSVAPNLTTLSQVTTDWQTHQGNSAHTGVVALTVNPANFTHRWRWTPPSNVSNASEVVSSGNTVFFSTNVGQSGLAHNTGNWLVAVDEATGQQKWVHDFGIVNATHPAAVYDGIVYASAKMTGWDSYNGLRVSDGQQVWSGTIASQWRYYQAPVVAGGYLIQHGGYNNGGIGGLGLSASDPDWLNDLWDEDVAGAVATDGGLAYTVMYGTASTPESEGFLAVVDTHTGGMVRRIRPTWSSDNHPFGVTLYSAGSPTPVLSGPSSVILAYSFAQGSGRQYHLEKIDTNTATSVWHIDQPFESSGACRYNVHCNMEPVVSGGVLYVLNAANGKLEARRESDGSVLWSWRPPAEDRSPIFDTIKPSLIATSNAIFVSTTRFVYAIDINTATAVWRHGGVGQLSVSGQGVLYISRDDGQIDAINLR